MNLCNNILGGLGKFRYLNQEYSSRIVAKDGFYYFQNGWWGVSAYSIGYFYRGTYTQMAHGERSGISISGNIVTPDAGSAFNYVCILTN